VIKLVNVQCSFDGVRALDSVTLFVNKGSLLGIMGPGGSGKSTLCKVACGLVQPESGAVVVDGVDIIHAGRRKLQEVQKRCGVQFQNDALFEHMTVLDNVAYPLQRLTELGGDEIKKKSAERIAMVGLAGFEDRLPNRLSGGQRRRVALARACVTDPQILICDDPTAGLDPVTSRRILDMIADIRVKTKSTVIIVSTDIPGLLSVCDEVALIWDGKVAQQGSPASLKSSDNEMLQRFLDDARLPIGENSWS